MTQEEQMYRTTRIVWYIFGAIEAILALRVILRILAANQGAAFTDLVYGISGIFIAPFRFVFGTPAAGGSALELNTILAMIVYYLIAWGIVKFIVMQRPVSTPEANAVLREEDTK